MLKSYTFQKYFYINHVRFVLMDRDYKKYKLIFNTLKSIIP